MPLFFFDYHDDQGGVGLDELGIDLPDFETAYREAYRAAIDMWAEARREGRDPGGALFVIRNSTGDAVEELPFAEAVGGAHTGKPDETPSAKGRE
jgi:hypothetical protein